jgi:hypothetical protein
LRHELQKHGHKLFKPHLGQAAKIPTHYGSKSSLKDYKCNGWNDHRLAFVHYASGRIMLASDPKAAFQHFVSADRYYTATPGANLHRADVPTQLATHAVTQGDAVGALASIGPYIDRAARSKNAILLSALLLLRAEALDLTGRSAEARTVRLDSLG